MYLGIDLGTSGVKVVILNDNDELVAQASSGLDVSIPQPLWSEQDPGHWWQATNDAVQQLKASHPSEVAAVKGIGLSGQMHGATILDANDQVIRPAILWNDGRSSKQCQALEELVPDSRKITGNIAMPGFTAPKLLWMKQEEPELFSKVKKVLLPKDYLRLLMTGEYAGDQSDCAGTLWLDVAKRDWSDEVLEACGLDRSHMPRLFEGTEVTGTLKANVAQDWGMNQVPVAAGGGDNAAGAAGIGVINPGDAFLSLGTSGVYFVANETYLPNPDGAVHTFCHCIPNTWHQMSVILSAASCLAWVTQLVQAQDEKSLLDEVAKLDFSKPCDVTFLPYLSGERTPHNDPNAKGVFFGLGLNTDRATLARAVLEGVAFAFADGQKVLDDAGTTIDQVSVIGGGSKSLLWGKVLASVLERPLIYRKGADVGPAFGAARLGRIAVTGESPSEVCVAGEVVNTVEPDSAMSSYYQASIEKYRSLYSSLKNEF